MGRLRVLSGREVCRILESQGFAEVRRRGSHVVMQRRTSDSTVTRYVGWKPKRTEEEARRFLDMVIADGGRGRPSWVIVRNGDDRAVGFIIAASDGEEAETS